MTPEALSKILEEKVLLLDGGMGTALMKRGLAAGRPGELWNAENPQAVGEVHARYIEAGCDAIQTNTFGASRLRLKTHGLEDRFEELNASAVAIARKAAGPDRLVAGNMGPSGLFLPPVGEVEPAALKENFVEQAAALFEAGVDYISIETMLDLKAALLALAGAKKGAPGLPVSVTLVFEKKKRGFFTPMGNRPGDAMAALAEAGADLVGANCSMGSDEMKEVVEVMVERAKVPVLVKPNAGLPETIGADLVYRQTPSAFAQDLLAMARMGARAVGGCCGTDERFIACLDQGLRQGGFRPR